MRTLVSHRLLVNQAFDKRERDIERMNDWIAINNFLAYKFDRIENGKAYFKSQMGHDAAIIDQEIWEAL